MALLNQQFLQNIGIELDEQTAAAFDQHFAETLKERVLEGVIETLSDEELQELVTLRDQDEEQLQTWLQTKVPDFARIVEDEVAILIGEVAENADSI